MLFVEGKPAGSPESEVVSRNRRKGILPVVALDNSSVINP